MSINQSIKNWIYIRYYSFKAKCSIDNKRFEQAFDYLNKILNIDNSDLMVLIYTMEIYSYLDLAIKCQEEKVIEKSITEINKIARNPENRSLTPQELKIKVNEQIMSNPELNTYFNTASQEKCAEIKSKAICLARRRQIEEIMELKGYVNADEKELIQQGFSEEEIQKIAENNILELKRLSKYTEKQLLEMDIPKEDIPLIKSSKNHNMVKKSRLLKTSDFESLYQISSDLSERGEYEKALRCLNDALKINPKHLDASNLKIGILKELGRDEEASKYIREDFIIRLNLGEKDATFWSMKGGIYMIDKKYNEAIKCFEKALKMDPRLFGCETARQEAIKYLKK